MYLQVFEINLGQETNRFIAGQIITGRVVLVLDKEKAVKGISIRLLGKGHVSWEAGISSLKYSHNVHSDSEVYADLKTSLLSRDDGREQMLESGRHDYCFSIQLPSNIPSSFEGEHGHIKYTLEASIQRSWKDDHTTVVPVEVRGIMNLNEEPKAAEPVKIYKEKHVGLLLCHNGPLIVNFLLSKAGFVPGEYLQFGVEIRNGANIRISSVIISLKSHVTYKTGNERKSQAEKVMQVMGPSVEMKGYLIWQNHFQIPDVPPNPLAGCKLMELKYYLEIKLVMERWSDMKICTPVVIGCIPYDVPETRPAKAVKLAAILEEPQTDRFQTVSQGNEAVSLECAPKITVNENQEASLPCIDWGSSACLAELEKISSRPVQTVPSFLLSASENLYAMSMGSCDKLSTNYEILDDRHIVFEEENGFDICGSQLQSLFLGRRKEDNAENRHNNDYYFE